MHDILRKLSQKNLFNYKKMDSSLMEFDDDQSLGKRFWIKMAESVRFFFEKTIEKREKKSTI